MQYYNEAAARFETIETAVHNRGYAYTYAIYCTMIGHGNQRYNENIRKIWETHPYVCHTIDSIRLIRMMLVFVSQLEEYLNVSPPTIYDFEILFPEYDDVVYQIQSNHRLIEEAVCPTTLCEIYKTEDFTVWFPTALPDVMKVLFPVVEMYQRALDLKINLKIVHSIFQLMNKLQMETAVCNMIDEGGLKWEDVHLDINQ